MLKKNFTDFYCDKGSEQLIRQIERTVNFIFQEFN